MCRSANGLREGGQRVRRRLLQLFSINRTPSLSVSLVHGFGALNSPAFATIALRVQLHQLHRFVRFATRVVCCVETSTFARFERISRWQVVVFPYGEACARKKNAWSPTEAGPGYMESSKLLLRSRGPALSRRSKIDLMVAFCAAQMLPESCLLSLRYGLRYSPKQRRRYGESRRRVKMARLRFSGTRSNKRISTFGGSDPKTNSYTRNSKAHLGDRYHCNPRREETGISLRHQLVLQLCGQQNAKWTRGKTVGGGVVKGAGYLAEKDIGGVGRTCLHFFF